MDEPPSSLLKSRIPRKTILADPYTSDESRIYNLHCPLRKGIIYYRRDGAIFEHNIHSSGKHEPRIIVQKRPSRYLRNISFIPIKGNQILLFARYYSGKRTFRKHYLHLSIHEIHSDHHVGPTLWSFDGDGGNNLHVFHSELIKSAENALRITFKKRFDDHWKLFDISTDTDASDKFPLIESGRIYYDLKKPKSLDNAILSPDGRILLNPDLDAGRDNDTTDIYYSDSDGTNNNFSFVSRISIPAGEPSRDLQAPILAFSANGSKFAMSTAHSGVSVWDIRSKVPLKTFNMEVPESVYDWNKRYLQFSSGKSGKEVLVFTERDNASRLNIIHVIDATSFETKEILLLKIEDSQYPARGLGALFFDPSGMTLYAEVDGTLYEWDLQEKKHGPEWWIGE